VLIEKPQYYVEVYGATTNANVAMLVGGISAEIVKITVRGVERDVYQVPNRLILEKIINHPDHRDGVRIYEALPEAEPRLI
jgi:small-conductance mechanosensitive channel